METLKDIIEKAITLTDENTAHIIDVPELKRALEVMAVKIESLCEIVERIQLGKS